MKTQLSALAVAIACGVGLTSAPALASTAPHSVVTPSLSTCSSTDAAIYTAPAGGVAGSPGALLACRATTLPEIPSKVSIKAWKVQYVSTGVTGQLVATTGTVAVPTAPWTGSGTRPVVAFLPGTLGLGKQCAFSKQIAGADVDEYEGDNIAALLNAGYGVAAADGEGYVGNAVHPYVAGLAAGHAILDAARTASKVPGSGLSATTKTGLWGYSEGGQGSLWGAQLAKSYAPDVNVVGDAAGGVPGDLKLTASQLDGSAFAGFLADAAVGLSTAYPKLPFTSLLNDAGRAAVAKAETSCLTDTLSAFAGNHISSYTTNGYTLDQLYTLKGSDGVTWGQVLDAQKLGVGVGLVLPGVKYQIGFPVFQYRGALEEVINTQAEDQTRARYCAAHVITQWNPNYVSEHLTTDNSAIGDVISFFGARFNGTPTLGNC